METRYDIANQYINEARTLSAQGAVKLNAGTQTLRPVWVGAGKADVDSALDKLAQARAVLRSLEAEIKASRAAEIGGTGSRYISYLDGHEHGRGDDIADLVRAIVESPSDDRMPRIEIYDTVRECRRNPTAHMPAAWRS